MRRRTLAITVVLVALGVVAALVLLLAQDPDRYRPQLAALLSDAAGYPVTLDGSLELRWRPSPALTAHDAGVEVPGARVRVERVEVSVDAKALLARRLRARQVRASGLRVEIAPQAAAQPLALPDPSALPVDVIELRDASLLRDGATLLSIPRATLREPHSARGARLDLELEVGGVRMEGRTRLAVAPERVELDPMSLRTPAGDLGGQLVLALDGARARLSGELSADALAFAAARGAGRVIPRPALAVHALQALDATLRLRVGRLSVGAMRVSDVSLPLTLREGRLEAKGRGIYATGTAAGTLAVSAAGERWTLDASLAGADAGRALVMLGITAAEPGGRLDATAALRASGVHADALLASVGGNVELDLAGVVLRAGAAQLAAADVLGSLLRVMRGDDHQRVALECGVARFAVRDGVLVAEQSIGVQSRTVNVLGGGRISLPDERLDLLLRPWAREGLRLSGGALVGAVSVRGPLAAPEVSLSSEAAWRAGASAGAAFLTGGLSLLAQGLLEHARGDAPCRQAAQGAGAAVPESRGSAAPAGVVDDAARAVDGALRGIGRTLEDVFGGAGRAAPAASGGRADP